MKSRVLNDGNQQWHFDFKDWREAFELFYRWKKKDSAFCLVISIHWVTSGYWIERDAKNDTHARVYRSVASVKALERRITDAQERAAARIGCKPEEVASLGGVIY